MVEFKNREDVRNWLDTRPEATRRAEAIVLASRAALRALPALAELKKQQQVSVKNRSAIILPVMYAMALPSAAATYPAVGNDNRFAAFAASAARAARAAADAASAADVASVASTAFAASAARAAAFAASVASAARAAADAAFAARATAFAAAFAADATQIETGMSTHALARQPLWPDGTPQWALDNWASLKSGLLGGDERLRAEDWGVWTDWYQARLDGTSPWSEAVETARVLELTPDDWEAGPAVANAKLREIMNRERGEEDVAGEGEATAGIDPPALPEPSTGVQFGERQQRLDIQVSRPPEAPGLSNRSKVLLDELREAVRGFEGSFDPKANIHPALRGTASRYQQQIERDDPDIDLIFALGLRLENADLAAKREIAAGLEPELENSQHAALQSLLQIHGVFIATSDDGRELLAAAERYQHKPQDDETFKAKAGPVIDGMSVERELATERALELVKDAIEEMNAGEHPARTGLIGRNALQNALLYVCKAAVTGILAKTSGDIFLATETGQFVIAHGAPLADKSIHFLLENAGKLRELIAVAPEGFGFVGRVIDWIKVRLGLAGG